MDKSLSKKISFLNFVFTIGIVIYHSKNFHQLFSNTDTIYTDLLYELYDVIGALSMGFFFTISGYLFYRGLDTVKKIGPKIKKRLLTLGIPFIVWNVLYLLYNLLYALISQKNELLSYSFLDVLLGFSFVPFNRPFWYIFALICIMLLSPIILVLKKSPRIFLIFLCTLTVGSYISAVCVVSDNQVIIWVVRLLNYLPTYLFGAYIALCGDSVMVSEKLQRKSVCIISGLISVLILIYLLLFSTGMVAIDWVLHRVLPISVWLSFRNKMFERTNISFALSISFFIYAMHSILIGILNTIISKIVGYNSLHPILTIPAYILFIACLYGICLFVAFLGKKLLPKKLYFALSGGRVN